MKYCCFGFLLILLPLSGLSSAELIVPLISSNGKVYVAAQVTAIDASEPRLVSAMKTGEDFIKLIKEKGVETAHTFFTNEDGSQSKVKSGQSPLNLERLRERIKSVSYGHTAIAWGDYLLLEAKYKTADRVIDFREDYFCSEGKCLKSLKEYGQVMENVYALKADYTGNAHPGNLADEMDNQNDLFWTVISVSPNHTFSVLNDSNSEENSANSLKLGVSILGLGEWQCIQCAALSSDDDVNSVVNNSVRKVAQQINDSNASASTSKVVDVLKKHSTSISGEEIINMVSWKSSGPEITGVAISDYSAVLEEALKGRIVGHIPDKDYIYLITGDSTTTPTKDHMEFQIFIMKSGLDSNGEKTYLFDPETAGDLDSQYWVYDPEFLGVIESIVKSTL